MRKEYLPQVTSDRIKALASSNGISFSQLNEICGLSKNAIAQSGKGTEGMKAKRTSSPPPIEYFIKVPEMRLKQRVPGTFILYVFPLKSHFLD